MVATTNLALRFLLELTGLAALAYAGYRAFDGPVRWLVAIGAPAALVLFWAFVVAPGADNPISPSRRELIGSLALLCAAAALSLAGHPKLALAFAALVVTNQVLLAVLRDDSAGPELAR